MVFKYIQMYSGQVISGTCLASTHNILWASDDLPASAAILPSAVVTCRPIDFDRGQGKDLSHELIA
jgi:hypothetical protein